MAQLWSQRSDPPGEPFHQKQDELGLLRVLNDDAPLVGSLRWLSLRATECSAAEHPEQFLVLVTWPDDSWILGAAADTEPRGHCFLETGDCA